MVAAMSPLERYRAVQAELQALLRLGSYEDEDEDELLDQMDTLWWQLTAEERKVLEAEVMGQRK